MRVNKYLKVAVYLYFFMLIYITFFLGNRHVVNLFNNKISLEFLASKKYYIENYDTLDFKEIKFIVLETFGNIVLFMPFTAALSCVVQKRLSVFILIISLLLAILGVELLQYQFHIGVFDIDDIVLNFTGGLIGLLLFNLFFRKYILK